MEEDSKPKSQRKPCWSSEGEIPPSRLFDVMLFLGGIVLIVIILIATFPVTFWYLVQGRKIDDREQNDL
jgi:hypothetical protein